MELRFLFYFPVYFLFTSTLLYLDTARVSDFIEEFNSVIHILHGKIIMSDQIKLKLSHAIVQFI